VCRASAIVGISHSIALLILFVISLHSEYHRELTDARVTTFLLARFCNLIFSSFRLPMCFVADSHFPVTVAALRRREARCGPTGPLAGTGRPSPGIAPRFEDSDPVAGAVMSSRPARTAFQRPPGTRDADQPTGLLRTAAPLALALPFRGPPQRTRTVPGSRGPSRRTMLPPLGFRAPRHLPERRTRSIAGPSGPAACRVRGLVTPCAASTTAPAGAREGARASSGFTLQGLLLAPVGSPFGGPCPRGVARVDFARSPVERTDGAVYRASIPASSSFWPTLAGLPPMPSWGSPLQSTHLPSSRTLLMHVRSPTTRWAGVTSRPACVPGYSERKARETPLGAPGSPGVCHLMTVAAPCRPPSGDGRMDLPRGSRSCTRAGRSEPPRTTISPER
jgi:hypothetical protein